MVLLNKNAKLVLISSTILGILSIVFFLSFALSVHTATTSEGGTSFNVLEDLGFVYNITINNSDAGMSANITQVNITLPGNFTYNLGPENGTDSLATFANESNVLSWSNFTGYLINGSGSVNNFWFNASVTTPGNYNINITTVNETGAFYTNISVVVNDTTEPSMINFTGQTPANNSDVVDTLPVNVSSADNGVIDSTIIYLYNSAISLLNTTIISGSSAYVNFTGLDNGTYYVNASVNDTYGNINSTNLRVYSLTSRPGVAAANVIESSSSSTGTIPFWKNTYVYNDREFSESETLTREYSIKHRVRIKVSGTIHHIGVVALTDRSVTVNVSSVPQQAILDVGKSAKFDVDNSGYYDVLVLLNSISNNKANITILSINEKVIMDEGNENTDDKTLINDSAGEGPIGEGNENYKDERSLWWIWLIVVVIIVAGIFYYLRLLQEKNRKKK